MHHRMISTEPLFEIEFYEEMAFLKIFQSRNKAEVVGITSF